MAQVEGIKYFHDLKVRSSGADIFVEVNIHVQPGMTTEEAHEIATAVEKQLSLKIPRAHVHVHIEPEAHKE
jgi:divalent metal cation (Fe/Co/Zn/Cd) transporter